MPTMNVNLTPELAKFVSTKVALGDYATASELVRDALRNLRRDRELEVQRIELLRRKLSVGLDQADRNEFSHRSVSEIAASVLAEVDE